jgi:hypothetical protein
VVRPLDLDDGRRQRRELLLPGAAAVRTGGRTGRGDLYLSAGMDYALYVNGHYVGRGPTPSDPVWQSYDSHDVTALLPEMHLRTRAD